MNNADKVGSIYSRVHKGIDPFNALSHWQLGERVRGLYMGVPFSGELNAYTRPTHDYRNVIFCVTLDQVIGVFGKDRTTVEVWTNHMNAENTLEREGDAQ